MIDTFVDSYIHFMVIL